MLDILWVSSKEKNLCNGHLIKAYLNKLNDTKTVFTKNEVVLIDNQI